MNNSSNVLKNLNTKYIGKNLIHYKEIDSTQKEIWRQVEKNNIGTGTIVMADLQTDAIGTHGRTWYTTQKDNIAFSFVIFPNVDINKFDGFTLEIAETLVETFKKIYNINLNIKLPNDLIINNKKVGGILTESKLQGNIIKSIVIGIGINTNQKEFNNEIVNIATSIKNEFNIVIDNNKVISEFCNSFEKKIEKRLGEN